MAPCIIVNVEVYQIEGGPMMLLVDVGNTQTVIGLAEISSKTGEYLAKWRISTDKTATSDDILAIIAPLLEISGFDLKDVDAAAVCSVVPRLELSWMDFLSRSCDVEAIRCSAEMAESLGLFDCYNPNPREIGADRIADAIAAKALYGSPVVVVDFGTATNMEVLDKDGRFIGGAIAPGIVTGSDALFSNASKIQADSPKAPANAIGTSTAEAVGSGVVLGQASMVDGLLERFFGELGYRASVVGTGGLVNVVAGLCDNITEICPDLTLDGLALLAQRFEEKETAR